MKTYILFISFVFCAILLQAQNSFFVVFKDKQGETFNPLSYFDAKAIDRKVMFGISIEDSTDFPVSETYVQKVEELSLKVGCVSRWFNGVFVWATNDQIIEIAKLPFVKEIILLQGKGQISSAKKNTQNFDNDPKSLALQQLSRMQGDLFQKNGIDGKGIRIAIFDGGFPEVDTHPAFKHIREEKRIIKTFDFTKNKDFVYSYNSHGLSTFSNIAGIYDSIPLGLATGAEFLLARTEVNSEPFAEEQYWLAAAEWADKNGAHIISSSLGYTKDRYFPEQMDGTHSLISKAANMAAQKGMLVINAMGNDGDNDWKVLSTPADADSIISVGGIDPRLDYHINFSSFGPTKDGRLKPNVAAYGKVTVATPGKSIEVAYGTSFATPLVSGFAACAWQTKLEKKNMEIKTEIEHSGDLFPYYDYAHGYGVPQASYFFSKEKRTKKEGDVFQFVIEKDTLLILNTRALDSTQLIYEKFYDKKLKENYPDGFLSDLNSNHLMFFHIANTEGKLIRYGVIKVFSKIVTSIPLSDLPMGYKVRIAYKNGFQEWTRELQNMNKTN